jgi:hypothetical protein
MLVGYLTEGNASRTGVALGLRTGVWLPPPRADAAGGHRPRGEATVVPALAIRDPVSTGDNERLGDCIEASTDSIGASPCSGGPVPDSIRLERAAPALGRDSLAARRRTRPSGERVPAEPGNRVR